MLGFKMGTYNLSAEKTRKKFDLLLQYGSRYNADISLLGMNSPICLEADCKCWIRDQTT